MVARTAEYCVRRWSIPRQPVLTCPLGIPGTDLCPLHRQLDESAAGADDVLARSTIAEISNLSREHAARGEQGL